MLGGYMAGVTVSGVLWAIFQNNAGGAWDNAKKSFEAGVEINGEMTYKGSEAHKAAVTGDTVGDPFKDTSGPSLNILLKLMSVVALVIAPSIAMSSDAVASYVNDKLESEETTAIVVAASEDFKVTIDAENEDKTIVVEVSLEGEQAAVLNSLDGLTSEIDKMILE